MTTIDELLTFHEVSQVLYRSGSAIDTKDWDALPALFMPDAVCFRSNQTPVEGVENIVEWIKKVTAKVEWQHHHFTVYHVEFDGLDRATVLTYCRTTTRVESGNASVIVARYHDQLRKWNGSWRFARREVELGWMQKETGDWQGLAAKI